jgi:hypothetical protein
MDENELKKNYYFKGKFFEHEEQFWKYVREWDEQKLDEETFKREWQQIGMTIFANMKLRNIELKNGQLIYILESCFLDMLTKLINNQSQS